MNFLWSILFIFVVPKILCWKKLISKSLLTSCHRWLVLGHSVLHLPIYLLHLYLLDINNILDFSCITCEHVLFSLAIILGFGCILFNEIACSNFNKYVVSIIHNSGNIEWWSKWYHYFFTLSIIFEVDKNLSTFLELSNTHL